MSGEIRKFATGATRDSDKDKLDYEGFLSPIVLQAYARYLHKHRIQSDGQLRSSDNWQQLFGDKHFDVCMKSLLRHVFDLWLIHRGFKPRRENGQFAPTEDILGGIVFNAMAYWFKLEKDRLGKELDLSE